MEHIIRRKPQALLVMEALNKRMILSRKEKQNLYSMTKGYEGECNFDDMIKEANPKAQIMKDLLLKVNGTTFQIDTILISSDTIYFYQFSERENPRFQSWDDSSAGMRVRFGELESPVIYSNIF